MAQTITGAEKQRAQRLGLTLEELRLKETNGFAWCNRCKQWKPVAEFCHDKSRYDGISRKCRACASTRKTDRLTAPEARKARERGVARCCKCKKWFPLSVIKGSYCNEDARAYARRRYAQDHRYRSERREHAHSRKRLAAPISIDDRDLAIEEFGGKCAYCDNPATTIDHVVPITAGGSSSYINIVGCCQSCNSSKNTQDVFDWMEKRGVDPRDSLLERLVSAVYVP